jgi:hypothetical protein
MIHCQLLQIDLSVVENSPLPWRYAESHPERLPQEGVLSLSVAYPVNETTGITIGPEKLLHPWAKLRSCI